MAAESARSLLLRSSFAWLPLLETSFFGSSWERGLSPESPVWNVYPSIVHKLSEIIYGINWEKVARLQVKLHMKKQHGHASWSMMRQTFSCLLSKYEVQNTIQCRYERQLSWLLTIIRSDLQHHLRHCLHATLNLRTKTKIFAIDLRMKADGI